MKICSGCREEKPLSEFYWTSDRSGRKHRHSRCKVCRRQQFSAWARTARGRAVKRAGILRRQYGVTEDRYDAMLLAQGGTCAVCKRPETRTHRNGTPFQLSVDHRHDTGEARALLCSACNVGLGSFREDPRLLVAAAAYLGGAT